MNQRVMCPGGCVHFERVAPGVCIVRTFTAPLAAFCPETGQPQQPWDWSCVGVVKGDAMTIHGALKAPSRNWMVRAIQAVHVIGIPTVRWEHWHGGQKVPQSFSFSRPDWPVATYPTNPAGRTTRPTETTGLSATNNPQPNTNMDQNEPDQNSLRVESTTQVVSSRGVECGFTAFSNLLTEKEATDMLVEDAEFKRSWATKFNLVTGEPQGE